MRKTNMQKSVDELASRRKTHPNSIKWIGRAELRAYEDEMQRKEYRRYAIISAVIFIPLLIVLHVLGWMP